MTKMKKTFGMLIVCVCMVFCGICASACSCGFVTETGYSEGVYDVSAAFSKIDVDADGGVNLDISYGTQFSVDYTESDQEKFLFSEIDGTLVVKQVRSVHANLIGYRSKVLKIIVPFENKILSVILDVDGAIDCNLAGDFGEIKFDVDGALDASMVGNAESLYVDCNGAVEIGNKDFVVNTAILNCNGAMSFEFTCNTSLKVDCNGACTGVYYGDCTVEKDITGTGNITKGQVEGD